MRYSGSFYENSAKYFEAENPFCLTCLTGAGAGNRGPNLLRMALAPDNMANAITMTSALDLPWQGRYTSTVQYNMMRQNDPFVSTAINGLAPAPLPGTSLNGKVDTLLVNNVLTTQITKDLKATFRYRYYDFDNQTPERMLHQLCGGGQPARIRATPQPLDRLHQAKRRRGVELAHGEGRERRRRLSVGAVGPHAA